MWWGKIVGAVIGFLIAGGFGAVVGFLIGHVSDLKRTPNSFLWHLSQQTNRLRQMRQAFFDATFMVMGHVAKIDGRISEEEIHAARLVMQRMNLTDVQKKHAIELFNQGKNPNFNVDIALANLLNSCHNNQPLLQMFVEIQLQAAQASGVVNAEKKRVLDKICQQLGYSNFQSGFGGGQYRQYQSHHAHHESPQDKLKQAYALLGVPSTATDAEVKKAYRKLISQHHPDKLVAKGLPEEMMKLATEKAQNIQLAYDQVRTARGF